MIARILATVLVIACAATAAPKKVVLIAGPITGHPKDTHEYEKNVTLLKHLLAGDAESLARGDYESRLCRMIQPVPQSLLSMRRHLLKVVADDQACAAARQRIADL